MNAETAKTIMDKIVGQVFGYQNPLSLEQFQAKFAFDVRLPQQVYDSTTNEPTWASSVNPAKFVKHANTFKFAEDHYARQKRPITSIQDILTYWAETNDMAAERYLDSVNVAESDDIRRSENVYRSQTVDSSKNIILTDGISNSEFIAASQRSNDSTFCIRLEDSGLCSNSFNVSWCTKVSNSFFIQDCANMQDCMFCSHMNSKRFCIANMQYEETEYKQIRDMVVRWILTSQ
jgi:hypothetical protein